MDATIRNRIEAMKADPNFVRFVMGWFGVIGATEAPFTAEKEAAAYQRKTKRRTQKMLRPSGNFIGR